MVTLPPDSRIYGLSPAHYNEVLAKTVIGSALHQARKGVLDPAQLSIGDLYAQQLPAASALGATSTQHALRHVLSVQRRLKTSIHALHAVGPPDDALAAFSSRLDGQFGDWVTYPQDLFYETWSAIDAYVRSLIQNSGLACRPTKLVAQWDRVPTLPRYAVHDVTASTQIGPRGAVIFLTLHADVSWRTLLALPYVLMHELFVHAHAQASVTDEENVFAEGWMDVLAASLCTSALLQRVPPITRHGDDAFADCQTRHSNRYDERFIEDRPLWARRRQGRDALRLLQEVSASAPSRSDLLSLIVPLSLHLNASQGAGERLEALARNLANWWGDPEVHQADLLVVQRALVTQSALSALAPTRFVADIEGAPGFT